MIAKRKIISLKIQTNIPLQVEPQPSAHYQKHK